jgi:XTP/dITP diphosphohydrolase
MSVPAQLVAATGNRGKLVEMRRILSAVPIEILGLDSFPGHVQPEETGSTYLENARIKAVAAARFTGLACFADDSGLEVDALEGAPGLHSSRFDGGQGTVQSRNRKLLELMRDVPGPERTARFRALVVLVEPDGTGGVREHSFEGVLEGAIATEPSGFGGFGYDPLFLLPELETTVACIDPGRKDELSHRGRAMRQMVRFLMQRLAPAKVP